MGITKFASEFTDDGDITVGTDTFSGMTLSSDNYEGEIQDITILPGRERQMGAPLTHGAQFELISDIGRLMRIARISTPDALYGASIPAGASRRYIMRFQTRQISMKLSM